MGGGYVSKHTVEDCTQFCDKHINKDDLDNYYYYEYDDYDGYEQKRRRRQADEMSYDTSGGGIGAGGDSIGKAWLYDGRSWEEIAPMTVARDRPSCSVLNMPNGKVILHHSLTILNIVVRMVIYYRDLNDLEIHMSILLLQYTIRICFYLF